MTIRQEFFIERQGRTFVLYQGLLEEAHDRGLSSIETQLVQIPDDANGNVAIAKARVTLEMVDEDGELNTKVFEDYGDASVQNVSKNIAPHITRMSVTRAKARALRDCVPLDTEILSREGFKTYDELVPGEEVLGYDVETDMLRWTTLDEVHVFESKPFVSLLNRNAHLTCTPTHRWVTRSSKGVRKLQTTMDMSSDSSIITAALSEGGEHPLSARDAAVLGWVATDGGIYPRPNGTLHANIVQSRSENLEEIERLLGEDCTAVYITEPGAFARETNVETRERANHIFNLVAGYGRYLLGLCGSGYELLPGLVTHLSAEARASMLDSMLKADGHKRSNGTWEFGKDSRPAVFEAFQILAVLEGIPLGRLQHYHDGAHTRQTTRLGRVLNRRFLDIKEEKSGPAWCPSTGLGTWVMRQNGYVTVTGNSINIGVTALEELGGDDNERQQSGPTHAVPGGANASANGQNTNANAPATASDTQVKRIHGLADEVYGGRDESMSGSEWLLGQIKHESYEEMTAKEANNLLNTLQERQKQVQG